MEMSCPGSGGQFLHSPCGSCFRPGRNFSALCHLALPLESASLPLTCLGHVEVATESVPPWSGNGLLQIPACPDLGAWELLYGVNKHRRSQGRLAGSLSKLS